MKIEDEEPFGEEWKKEIKKLPKDLIVDLYSKKGIRCNMYKEECKKLNDDVADLRAKFDYLISLKR